MNSLVDTVPIGAGVGVKFRGCESTARGLSCDRAREVERREPEVIVVA